jgi:hypothetical protein
LPAVTNAGRQPVDDLSALRTPVDVIADHDNDAGFAARVRGDFVQRAAEQIVPAVDVRNDVSEAHAA